MHFFSSNRLPLPQKPRYRQRRNGALAMHPPFCLSARLLYSATKTPAEPPDSYLFQPIDGGELSMTAFQVIAFFLRRGTSRTPVSGCPASAIKKPGKVSPLRVEGITDLPAFNNLCFLPFSLLFPVTQAYQGIWHCLIPLPGRSRPSRFHSCSSATPETAGERCLPPLRPW